MIKGRFISVFLLVALGVSTLQSCDSFRRLAGRPTSDEIAAKRELIQREEAAHQARMDSLRRIEKAKADDFKEATARSYVSRALKKEKLTCAQMATLKARVQALIEHGCVIGPDTMNQLKKIGAL